MNYQTSRCRKALTTEMLMPLDTAKIKARRLAMELTQADAAERAHMPRPNWIRMEAGRRPDPSLSSLERMAEALECSILDLVTDPVDVTGPEALIV